MMRFVVAAGFCVIGLGLSGPHLQAQGILVRTPAAPEIDWQAGVEDLAVLDLFGNLTPDALAVVGGQLVELPDPDINGAQAVMPLGTGFTEVEPLPGAATSGADAFVALGTNGLVAIEYSFASQSYVTVAAETSLTVGASLLRVADIDKNGIDDVLMMSVGGSLLRFEKSGAGFVPKVVATAPAGVVDFEVLDFGGTLPLDIALLTSTALIVVSADGSQTLLAKSFPANQVATHCCVTRHPAHAKDLLAYLVEAPGAAWIGAVGASYDWFGTIFLSGACTGMSSGDFDATLNNGDELVLVTNSQYQFVLYGQATATAGSALWNSLAPGGVAFEDFGPGNWTGCSLETVFADLDGDSDTDSLWICEVTGEVMEVRGKDVDEFDYRSLMTGDVYIQQENYHGSEYTVAEGTDNLKIDLAAPREFFATLPNAIQYTVYERRSGLGIDSDPVTTGFYTDSSQPGGLPLAYLSGYGVVEVVFAIPEELANQMVVPGPGNLTYEVRVRPVVYDGTAVTFAYPWTALTMTDDEDVLLDLMAEFESIYGYPAQKQDIIPGIGGGGSGSNTGGVTTPIVQDPFQMPPPRQGGGG